MPTHASGAEEHHVNTLLAHSGCKVDETTGAVTPPIHLSSTYERDKDLGFSKGFIYARVNNPTRQLLEENLAALDNGKEAAVFSSGQAAAAAIFQALPGGHVIMPDDIYHGIRTLMQTTFTAWGLASSEVDMSNLDHVKQALEAAGPRAAAAAGKRVVVWLETPSNPATKITDIEVVAKLAHSHGYIVVVDSTWVTPLITRPIDLGADLVVHSVTKYLGGHSDLTGGCVVAAPHATGEDSIFAKVRHSQCFTGGGLAPFDCWLCLRGMRSLGARMPVHSKNAMAVAQFLEAHEGVTHVFYPGLESHPGHATAKKQMKGGFAGMLSFRVKGGKDAAIQMVANLKLFKRATSLGGTETLIEHRASIEPADTPTPWDLLRVSVGLEHIDDLIADLAQSLAAVGTPASRL